MGCDIQGTKSVKTKDFDSVKEARKIVMLQQKYYKEMMKEDPVSPATKAAPVAKKSKKSSKKKLFAIDTITIFNHRYFIEANELDHAYDEVTMIDSGDDSDMFEAAQQVYLGETIIGGQEISKKDFRRLLKEMEIANNGDYWLGEKLIRVIDYEKNEKKN